MTHKIIAIAGGSCSGKTTLARSIAQRLGPNNCSVVYQDNYYRGLAQLTNFDIPEAIEFELMAQHLSLLKSGEAVDIPTYDFATHRRQSKTLRLRPKTIIIVDGILILHAPELRNSFDFKVYVECEMEQRKQRRLERDRLERGRQPSDILRQFNEQVLPLHEKFVAPSKQYANRIYNQTDLEKPFEYGCADLLSYCEEHCNT